MKSFTRWDDNFLRCIRTNLSNKEINTEFENYIEINIVGMR